MELIKPSSTVLCMSGHPELPYQYYPNPELLIEASGRNCYKSEEKITEGSAKRFMFSIFNRKHFTVLEHSWQLRQYFCSANEFPLGNWNKFLHISNVREDLQSSQSCIYIGGTFRAFEEASVECPQLEKDHLIFDDEWTAKIAHNFSESFLMAATVRLINDRGVSHEEVRHRPLAISQESTRYVDYNAKGMQFIIPPWIDFEEGVYNFANIPFGIENTPKTIWFKIMLHAQEAYNDMLNQGWNPQQARSVLPNSLKTELVITATLKEWQHIFMQRALSMTGKAHPQMEEVMIPLHEKFIELDSQFFNKEGKGYE